MIGYKIPKGFVEGYRNAIEQYPQDSQYAWGMNAVVEALEVHPLEELDENPWHTGTPTEEGNYITHLRIKSRDGEFIEYDMTCNLEVLLNYIRCQDESEENYLMVKGWLRYEPYKEKQDGHTDQRHGNAEGLWIVSMLPCRDSNVLSSR